LRTERTKWEVTPPKTFNMRCGEGPRTVFQKKQATFLGGRRGALGKKVDFTEQRVKRLKVREAKSRVGGFGAQSA